MWGKCTVGSVDLLHLSCDTFTDTQSLTAAVKHDTSSDRALVHLEVCRPTRTHPRPSSSQSSTCCSYPRPVPGLEYVRTHAPVLSVLRLPVAPFVHKVRLPGDGARPLVKPQRLVAFVFSTCRRERRRQLLSPDSSGEETFAGNSASDRSPPPLPEHGGNQSLCAVFGIAPNKNGTML